MNVQKILDYVNIGRRDEDFYTENEIQTNVEQFEKLSWGITDKDDVIPNCGYYKDKKQWVKVIIRDGLAKEVPVNANIVAYIPYKERT
jgi:hypothetical protein